MSRRNSIRAACCASALASVALLLGACSNMSALDADNHYACKAPVGVACDSVSGTYANAIHNNLPSQRSQVVAPAMPALQGAGASSAARTAATPLASATPQLAMATEGLLRSPPRVLRLWTQAWEDRDGDLHDQAYVYVQVDTGQWRIAHIRRQVRDPFRPVLAPPVAQSTRQDPAPQASDPTPSRSGEPLEAPRDAQEVRRPAPVPYRMPLPSPFGNDRR